MDCFKNLLCKLGHHHYVKQAHWCDKECTVAIVEYMCSRCGSESFDLILFDDMHCKVLKRIPMEISALMAPEIAKCGEVTCEIAAEEKPKKRAAKARTAKKTA